MKARIPHGNQCHLCASTSSFHFHTSDPLHAFICCNPSKLNRPLLLSRPSNKDNALFVDMIQTANLLHAQFIFQAFINAGKFH